MKYEEICSAKFIDRPNRFIAHVALKEAEEAGVRVLYLPCRVTRDSIYADCGSEKIIREGDW